MSAALAPRRARRRTPRPRRTLLDAFAVLRRPRQPPVTIDPGDRLAVADEVTVDYIRRARVLPDGTEVYVVPAVQRAARPRQASGRSAPTREREALAHRLRGKPAQAQRAARRLLRAPSTRRQAASLPPQPGLFVFESGPRRRRRRSRARSVRDPPARRAQLVVRPRSRLAHASASSPTASPRSTSPSPAAAASTSALATAIASTARSIAGRQRSSTTSSTSPCPACRATRCSTGRCGTRRTARWSTRIKPPS